MSGRAAPFKVGFCVSGGGRLFQAAALNAQGLGIAPALVVAERNAAADLDTFCFGLGIPLVRLAYDDRKKADRQIAEVCIDARLDLLCLTFDKLIPSDLVAHYRERIINVHMGLLPAFKGMRALDQAIDSGTQFAGATIHEVDELMDNGPIIAQCIEGVHNDDTASTIGARLFENLRQMYLQVIAWYAEGRVYKDHKGRIRIRNAVYGQLPICPGIERSFLDAPMGC